MRPADPAISLSGTSNPRLVMTPTTTAVATAWLTTFPKLRIRLVNAPTTPCWRAGTAPMIELLFGTFHVPRENPMANIIGMTSNSGVDRSSVENPNAIAASSVNPAAQSQREPTRSDSRPENCAAAPIPAELRKSTPAASAAVIDRRLIRKTGVRKNTTVDPMNPVKRAPHRQAEHPVGEQ